MSHFEQKVPIEVNNADRFNSAGAADADIRLFEEAEIAEKIVQAAATVTGLSAEIVATSGDTWVAHYLADGTRQTSPVTAVREGHSILSVYNEFEPTSMDDYFKLFNKAQIS